MKNIGVVVPQFPVASETFVVTEINALASLGHQVTVFAFKEGSAWHLPLNKKVNVIFLPEQPDISLSSLVRLSPSNILHGVRLTLLQVGSPFFSLFRYSCRLAQAARVMQCTHLHSHFMNASLAHTVVAGKLLSIPVSTVGHGHDVYSTPTDLREKLAECNFAVAVCNNMKDMLSNITSIPLHLIHCGVDINSFTFNRDPEQANNTLLFVGRLVEKKGISYALMALAKIPHHQRPTLDIVGEGPQKASLQKLVLENNLQAHVQFLGYKKPQWLQENSRHYGCLIAPFCQATNGDRDTGPLVLKEAMAMGLPVITTDFMGCKEIVITGTGFVVKPQSVSAIQNAIEAFLALAKQDRFALSQRGRTRVEKEFCAHRQAQQLSLLIEQGPANVSA